MIFKEKKNGGFTLVELVVAVAVLGVVTAIALPTIGILKKNNERKKYVSYERSVTSSVKLYTDTYEEDLFNKNDNNAQCRSVTFSELKSRNLLKEYNLDGVTCTTSVESEDIAAYIVKEADGKYSYYPTIKCQKAGATTPQYKSTKSIPTICGNNGNNQIAMLKDSPCFSTGNNAKVSLSFDTDEYAKYKDSIDELKYGLIESKDSNKTELVKNLTYYDIDINKAYNGSEVKLDLKDTERLKKQGSTSKDYKLVVRLKYNQDENYQYQVLNQTIRADYAEPKINIVAKKYKKKFDSKKTNTYIDYKNNSWTNENVHVTATVNSCGNIIPIKPSTTNQSDNSSNENITKEGEHNLTFKAEYGNDNTTLNEKLIVKIDRTPPTVPTVTLKKWSDNTDSGKPTDENGDKPYTNFATYTNNAWSKYNIYTRADGSTDAGSGDIKYYYITTGATKEQTEQQRHRNIKAEGTSQIKYYACDAVGNCSAHSNQYTVKIDKTPPTVPTVTLKKWSDNNANANTIASNYKKLASYTNDTWSKYNVYTRADSTDAGSGNIKYYYTTTGATTKGTNVENQERNIAANGTSGIKYYACDAAGNCSTSSSQYTVKIDKVAPSCTSSGGSSNWTNKAVTLTGTCNDGNGSGCTKNKITKTIANDKDTNSNISPGTVYDNAGNSNACPTQSVKIDVTPPTVPTVTLKKWSNNTESGKPTDETYTSFAKYSNNTWSKYKVYTRADSTDTNGSGVANYYYKIKEGSESESSPQKARHRNIKSSGTYKIRYQACDTVGNCSAYSSQYTVKVDTEAPKFVEKINMTTCGITKNSYYKFGYKFTDNLSGISTDNSYFKYCYSTKKGKSFPGDTCSSKGYSDAVYKFGGTTDGSLSGEFLGGTSICLTRNSAVSFIKAEFKICDKAGNCATKSNEEYTPPSKKCDSIKSC